ncbi:MAG TPA: hypothetical protein VE753_08255 [Gaiellaceae bacterium]|nr:hypothetical protein [Gaiellaceae bacterium]
MRAGAGNYVVFGGLQLVNLARYPHTLEWGDARSWLYVLFVAGMIAFGAETWRRALARGPVADTGSLEPTA